MSANELHRDATPLPPSRVEWRAVLDVVATCCMIVSACIVAWRMLVVPGVRPAAPRPVAVPTEPLSLAGATVVGDSAAPLVMVEFSDFQCPYCGRFARETLPQLTKKYVDTGRMRIAFRNLPLAIHPFAQKAAEGALCAGESGQFWRMHDLLFQDQNGLGEDAIVGKALSLGLAEPAFRACLNGTERAQVEEDASIAKNLGLTGTPSFFVGTSQDGGRRVRVLVALAGAQPPTEFAKAIDAALAKAAPATSGRGHE
jgi:protein-disulfide isomerase